MRVLHSNIGKTHFSESWEIQRSIHAYKQKNPVNDVILSTEHFPVYTLGKTGERDHLLINEVELSKKEIEYFEIDRGGDITYHGPGQLVVYPIFDLNNYYKDTHRFLRDLEEAVILTLDHYNIKSSRDEEYTGVWAGEEKICAIGIKVSRWITMHGLALNVNSDLANFDSIIPCGIFHKGVTSIKKILNSVIEMKEVNKLLIENLARVFGLEMVEISKQELLSRFVNTQRVTELR